MTIKTPFSTTTMSSPTEPKRILIVGAGVSGSIVAYFLAKQHHQITVIERSKAEQHLGQGIEIESPATSVVQAMGIMSKLQSVKTGELGFSLVDEKSHSYAKFEAGGAGPTGALELMRGDLTEVLYKAADEANNVTYRFETTIQALRQSSTGPVTVDLTNRSTGFHTTETFDLVIAADGARSKTRSLLMGSPEEINCFKPVGAHVAYFSVPREKQDWPYSRMCNFSGRRIIWMRPTRDDSDVVSAYLMYIKDDKNADDAIGRANASGDRRAQKEEVAKAFRGCGWEGPRVVKAMMEAQNFYSDTLMQVKLPTWSQDNVVLLGDAAWAPTPFTGQGNHLAILGAFILAQELSRDPTAAAFQKYEKRFRSYVENAQAIPLSGYAPKLLVPRTKMGIWTWRHVLQTVSRVVRFVDWSGIGKMFPEGEGGHAPIDLQMEGVEGMDEKAKG